MTLVARLRALAVFACCLSWLIPQAGDTAEAAVVRREAVAGMRVYGVYAVAEYAITIRQEQPLAGAEPTLHGIAGATGEIAVEVTTCRYNGMRVVCDPTRVWRGPLDERAPEAVTGGGNIFVIDPSLGFASFRGSVADTSGNRCALSLTWIAVESPSMAPETDSAGTSVEVQRGAVVEANGPCFIGPARGGGWLRQRIVAGNPQLRSSASRRASSAAILPAGAGGGLQRTAEASWWVPDRIPIPYGDEQAWPWTEITLRASDGASIDLGAPGDSPAAGEAVLELRHCDPDGCGDPHVYRRTLSVGDTQNALVMDPLLSAARFTGTLVDHEGARCALTVEWGIPRLAPGVPPVDEPYFEHQVSPDGAGVGISRYTEARPTGTCGGGLVRWGRTLGRLSQSPAVASSAR